MSNSVVRTAPTLEDLKNDPEPSPAKSGEDKTKQLPARLLEDVLVQNNFLVPAYTHYGGVAGLQMWGPLGVRLKQQLLSTWRSTFLTSLVDEIETPTLTPRKVLQASGHLQRFTDLVAEDEAGNSYRVDHLLEENRDKLALDSETSIDSLTPEEQQRLVLEAELVIPEGGKPISFREENLMYQVSEDLYLRPELAQGIFLGYLQVSRMRRGHLPFGVAQIGSSYRKEISSKPFTRLREFSQAEIEFFYSPLDTTHPEFDSIADQVLPFFPAHQSKISSLSLREALEKHYFPHQIFGYYLAQIWSWAQQIGLDPSRLRFRQHHAHEMAHYATSCWDLEAEINGGWLEIVGCADRGNFDLSQHNHDQSMICRVPLPEPKKVTQLVPVYSKKDLGQLYRKKFPRVVEHLLERTQDELKAIQELFDQEYAYSFDLDLETHLITAEHLKIETREQVIKHHEFVPHVLEPSFGLDRIVWALLQHSYWTRPQEPSRGVLSLSSQITPWVIGVYQLSNHPDLLAKTKEVRDLLAPYTRVYTDFSNTSIGKRYVRCDEIGIPHILTIDFETLTDHQVTVRDRDSTEQRRVSIVGLVEELKLCGAR